MNLASILNSTLEQTTPILLAALAALVTQRANILNVAVEGMMLVAAFIAIAVGTITGSATLAALAGVAAAVGTAQLLSLMTLRFHADFIVAGLGINLLAAGGTLFLLERVYRSPGGLRPTTFPDLWQIPPASVAWMGGFGRVLAGQSIVMLLALLAIPAVWAFLYRTPVGSSLRAAGEDPDAARSAGISVVRMKALAVTISGLLGGLGGVHLAMAKLQFFLPDMTSGRGFIGLAASLFGGGLPWPTAAAAALFGFFGALGDRLQAFAIPAQFVLMLPYAAAILGLVFARWRVLRRNRPAPVETP